MIINSNSRSLFRFYRAVTHFRGSQILRLMIGLLGWKNGGVTSALPVRLGVKFFGTNSNQDKSRLCINREIMFSRLLVQLSIAGFWCLDHPDFEMIIAAEVWIHFQSMAKRSRSDRMSYKMKKATKSVETTTVLYLWDRARRAEFRDTEGECMMENLNL